jgi:archaellin
MKTKKAILLFMVIFVLFYSCTKEDMNINGKNNNENIEKEINNYSVSNAKWLLVKKDVVMDNQIGCLYVNENDSIETMFKVIKTEKSASGNKEISYTVNPNGGATTTCSGTGTSCSVSVQRDGNGNITGARITTYY